MQYLKCFLYTHTTTRNNKKNKTKKIAGTPAASTKRNQHSKNIQQPPIVITFAPKDIQQSQLELVVIYHTQYTPLFLLFYPGT